MYMYIYCSREWVLCLVAIEEPEPPLVALELHLDPNLQQ